MRKLALDLVWASGAGIAGREMVAAGSELMTRYIVPGTGLLGKALACFFGGCAWLGGIATSIENHKIGSETVS